MADKINTAGQGESHHSGASSNFEAGTPVPAAPLPERIIAVCRKRGWSLHWTHRGAYLHLESSELIEAVRGKHGDPLKEAADVLLVLMSITQSNGIKWESVEEMCSQIVDDLFTKPPYPGEEHTPGAPLTREQIEARLRAFVDAQVDLPADYRALLERNIWKLYESPSEPATVLGAPLKDGTPHHDDCLGLGIIEYILGPDGTQYSTSTEGTLQKQPNSGPQVPGSASAGDGESSPAKSPARSEPHVSESGIEQPEDMQPIIYRQNVTRNCSMSELVDRFLSWPLPSSVCSDGCVTTRNYPLQRIGTNLLTADEARQMLECVLESPSESQATD